MEIQQFKEVLAKAWEIVDVGIKKGYFKEETREELENKLSAMFKNGIEYDIEGKAIYGCYVPSQKKLYFNAKVYENEQEALIYILHEIKHGLDDFGERIGFQENSDDKNVGINEGATQRFATDLAEEILGEKIPETEQKSLGVPLRTKLDEYQIEDHLNELFCKALEISRADFLTAQNEESMETFNKIIQQFNKNASFETFQEALDKIYLIQTETWYDKNGNLLETEAKPTQEQTQRAIQLIKECEIEIFKYIQKTNPDRLEELKGDFIMPMNEYGEIVRNIKNEPEYRLKKDGTLEIINEGDIEIQNQSNEETMNDRDMLYQADYLEYQNFLMSGIDLGNNELVFISGLEGLPFDATDVREPTIKKLLEKEKVTEKIFVRSGDVYKVANITFDKNGVIEISDYETTDSLDEIVEHIEHSEVIGNASEYIRILKLQGKDEEAKKIEKKHNYFEENKSKIDEIKKKLETREKSENSMYDESYNSKKDFQEVAEDPQSIEARKKVLEDLMRAKTNEKSQENDFIQGE